LALVLKAKMLSSVLITIDPLFELDRTRVEKVYHMTTVLVG